MSRRVAPVTLGIAALALLLACSRGGPPATPESGEAPGPAAAVTRPPLAPAGPAVPMPAPSVPYVVTYGGVVPCADCAAIRLTLTLFPDDTYRLRQDYLGVPGGTREAFFDLGRRVRPKLGETTPGGASAGEPPPDDSLLVLRGGGDGPTRFRSLQPDRLRQLDKDGQEIASQFNYDLTLQPGVDPIAGPLRLSGLYTYMADAAVFEECLTGRRFPVIPVAEAPALETAYLAARHAPGKPLLATVTGVFVERAPEPGLPVRDHLIVEHFDRVWPGFTCAGR